MAMIKSYTDISQSKKLAEILSLESADMYYAYYHNPISGASYYEEYPIFHIPMNKNKSLPCWSLAALLGVFEDRGFYYKLYFDGVFNVLEVTNIDNPNIHEMNYNDYSIDTCYEMIINLHKQNLL